jgi:hypothetical protein
MPEETGPDRQLMQEITDPEMPPIGAHRLRKIVNQA